MPSIKYLIAASRNVTFSYKINRLTTKLSKLRVVQSDYLIRILEFTCWQERAWGRRGETSGAAAGGCEINILNEKELIFCTKKILNYWVK